MAENVTKLVIERRAEMATVCECLAAWDDGRECVCDKVLEIPISTEKLDKAHSLVKEIKDCDRRISHVQSETATKLFCYANRSAPEGTWSRRHHTNGGIIIEDMHGNIDCISPVTFDLPKAIILAALREERADLMCQLQETGIVSVDSATIRGVLK